jgi:myo-inositol-1(or 4)-monophosphatase
MDFTNDFFIQAQGVIERVFRSVREELIAASGNIDTDRKSDNTVVTRLDHEVEAKLREALLAFDGAIGIEGEELGVEGSRDTFWLLDPIDGTDAFTRGLPYYRNMASLIHNGEVIFAMVYRPVTDELYVAAKGDGAFRNGQQIKVSERTLKESRIELHYSKQNPQTWRLLERLSPSVEGLRISGDFLTVAEGKQDALLVYRMKWGTWDSAPRALLIQEAGGRVANLGKTSFDYTDPNFLAANPVIFDELMELIVKTDASL